MSQGRRPHLLIWAAAIAMIGVALIVTIAGAALGQVEELNPVSVTVDVGTIVRGDPGYTENVRMLTPADLGAEPGWVCDLVGFGDNGNSTHDGTNGIISSNGDQVMIPDWERAANTRTEATNGTLTLGATITIAIQVGGDGVASGGLEIQFTCNPPTTTTSTTATPTTTTTTITVGTTTTTTQPSVTTTTEPPPINGPETGGGACAGGACDGFRLSPGTTWAFLSAALLIVLSAAAIMAVRNADE